MKKTEWGFFVDVKTGKSRLVVPKQTSYKPGEILKVLNGTHDFLNTVLAIFNTCWKEGK